MKSVSFTLASILFFVSFLGACLAFSMEHDMPIAGDCLHIVGRSLVCPMGLGEHLNAWGNALISQPMKFFSVVFLVFVGAGACVVSRSVDPARASPKHIGREWIFLTVFLPLRRLFSRGILHPKIFDHVV